VLHKAKIALHGKMKSGKDALGVYLSAQLGIPVVKFAYPLYMAQAALLGEDVTRDRAFLQDVSTYLTDKKDGHFVELFEKQHPRLDEDGCVITDLRRPIEYAWCKANGFLMVKLEVAEETQIARGAEFDRLDHPTETALDVLGNHAWDVVLPDRMGVYERGALVWEALQMQMQAKTVTASYPPQFGIQLQSQVQHDILNDVLAERLRQDQKWGEQNHHPLVWSAIEGEEQGEMTQQALRILFGGPKEKHLEGYYEEFVQVAAVAIAALESLRRGTWLTQPADPGEVVEVLNTGPGDANFTQATLPLDYDWPEVAAEAKLPVYCEDHGLCRGA